MNENNIFEERTEVKNASGKKPVHTASLVLGILSLVFALLIALVGEILGIIGIVQASRKRKNYNTKAALICSIIGLVLAVGNHILGILMTLSMLA